VGGGGRSEGAVLCPAPIFKIDKQIMIAGFNSKGEKNMNFGPILLVF